MVSLWVALCAGEGVQTVAALFDDRKVETRRIRNRLQEIGIGCICAGLHLLAKSEEKDAAYENVNCACSIFPYIAAYGP